MNKKCLLFFCIVLLLNFFLNGKFELHYDEAYYWVLSQNLSLSYYDHPPMIAFIIRLFSIFGHSEFAVRLSALSTTCITVIVMYKFAKRMFGQQVADITCMLALAIPLIQALCFITTPDSPLLMFWSLTLYCFYVGVFETKAKYIYLTGVFAGFALVSKYTAVLIFPSLFIFLILSNNYRKYIFRKEIYIALIIACVMFMPVIYWNYQHDWASFKFQFQHGIDSKKELNFATPFDYLGGQVLISGILIFIAMLFFTFKYIKINIQNDKLAFLFWPFVFVFCFFGYRSLFQHMEANWPAPMYVSGIVWLSYWLKITNIKWVYRTAVGLILIVLILGKFPLTFVPNAMYNTQFNGNINVFYGSHDLLEQIKPYIHKNDIILACDYGNASHAWFYLNLPRVCVLSNFTYSHMYQYWNNDLPQSINHALYICDNDDKTAFNNLKDNFRKIELLDIAKYNNKIGSKVMYIYKASN